MMKVYTAYTREIDEVDLAVSEILEKIPLDKLLKNSLGILTCYSEFIDTGVVKELCEKLPFDVVGCTTMGSATNGNFGHLELSLLVLTSDDIAFSAAVSTALSEEQDQPLRSMYKLALEKLNTEPVFMISFAPLIYNVSGELFLSILNDVSNGLPNFGTLAVDHTSDYSQSQTIFNGEAYSHSYAAVLVGGNVEPRFLIASLASEKTLKQKAIITDSADNILKSVNDIPVIRYMESLGLTKNGQIEGPSTIPFVVDFNDGTVPVTRAIFAQTPEGYAVCGGTMPVNSTLSIGSLDYADVIETTKSIIKEIDSITSANAVISFSCIGRNYALGVQSLDELETVSEALGEKLPFAVAYSGGEICPVSDTDGNRKNRFHNDTIVACVI